MTGQEIVTSALRKIRVIGSGETPSTDESNDGLAALNAMVTNWNESLKLALAGTYASVIYTFTAIPTFASLATSSTLPDGWNKALIWNLAIDLAPEYGKAIDAGLAATAVAARASVVKTAGGV